MAISTDLAKQCSVIIPALSLALAVQIRRALSDLRSQGSFVSALVKESKRVNVRYARSSEAGRLIIRTSREATLLRGLGMAVYGYVPFVLLAEMACLMTLTESPGLRTNSSFLNSNGFVICMALIGLAGILVIPSARFFESALFRHPRTMKKAREVLEDRPSKGG